MNLEGGYGVFIYTLIPIAFIVVLGAKALSNSALSDPKTIFVTFAGKIFPGVAGQALNWIIAAMLIVALALSALNAIMGSGRALYQMALDGEFPTWFTKLNRTWRARPCHGFQCRLFAACRAGRRRVEIYSFSNVGYTISFIPVLIGYFLLRQDKPELRAAIQTAGIHEICRPALAVIISCSGCFGGLWYSKLGNVEIYYWAGWATLLAYLPLYWYRKYEDKRKAGDGSQCDVLSRARRRSRRSAAYRLLIESFINLVWIASWH